MAIGQFSQRRFPAEFAGKGNTNAYWYSFLTLFKRWQGVGRRPKRAPPIFFNYIPLRA